MDQVEASETTETIETYDARDFPQQTEVKLWVEQIFKAGQAGRYMVETINEVEGCAYCSNLGRQGGQSERFTLHEIAGWVYLQSEMKARAERQAAALGTKKWQIKNPAKFVGVKIDPTKWAIPAGYEIDSRTDKFQPIS